MHHSTPPFDLVIGLDRSDQKADLHCIEVRSGTRRAQTIGTGPGATTAGEPVPSGRAEPVQTRAAGRETEKQKAREGAYDCG